MDKHTLRKWIRQQKASHAPSERDAFSHKACLSVMGSPEWRNAHCVLLYHPLPDEVDVRPLIAAATEEGKRVVLPQVVGDDTVLRLYTSEQDLQPGAFGIMEPTGPLFTNYSSIDLAIIPGMAFDSRGNRLGRGKGYYDRLLARLPHARKVGICFPFQFVESIPADAHDIPMHEVVDTFAWKAIFL